MKEQAIEIAQNVASSKTALGLGLGTASAPAWIETINSDYMQALIILVGLVVSFTIVSVNIQTLRVRSEEAKTRKHIEGMRAALLEEQLAEKGIEL